MSFVVTEHVGLARMLVLTAGLFDGGRELGA
jgi:hypothetical protein